MDGLDRRKTLWKNFKQRLRFKGCFCGSSWDRIVSDIGNVRRSPAAPVINLAEALAADRQSVSSTVENQGGEQLKSLMRLFEETDGWDGERESEREGGGNDTVCCVCMERSKGAAFIPCGHTFCRVCSKDLWLNRGICPLCNRWIVKILDIF